MCLFHSSGFVLLKLIISVSTDAIKMFANATAIFVPMGSVYLEIVFIVEFKRILLKYQSQYLSEGECRDRAG